MKIINVGTVQACACICDAMVEGGDGGGGRGGGSEGGTGKGVRGIQTKLDLVVVLPYKDEGDRIAMQMNEKQPYSPGFVMLWHVATYLYALVIIIIVVIARVNV